MFWTNRPLSRPSYACCSPIPHFFITSIFGKPGEWSTRFNFIKHIGKGEKLGENAVNENWRKQQKRLFKKYCKAVGLSDRKDVPLLLGVNLEELREKYHERYEWADEEVTPWWLLFVHTANQVKEQYPDSPISHLLMFLTTLENRKFTHEEMLMWMLCAYLEWIWLDRLVLNKSNGNGDSKLDFVHINYWKPMSEINRLCTTRYRVLNEYLECRDDRNYRHLLGPKTYDVCSAKTSQKRKLSVDKATVELYDFTDMTNKESSELEKEQYKRLFSFVNYFECVQLDMLAQGIPAIRIEASFSRIDEIQRTFQDELDEYFKRHSV